MSQTQTFKPGDMVRVTGYAPWVDASPDHELLPIGTTWKVDASGMIDGWETSQGYAACHLLELVEEPTAVAEPAKDIGLEFLNSRLSFVATLTVDSSTEWDRGYTQALEELAAAYGKRIQHVNHMDLVDVE